MTDPSGYKTIVWDVPDHDCHLDTIDVVDQTITRNTFLNRRERIYKFMQQCLLISRSHPYTLRKFKSNNAIVMETVRHLKEAPSTIHPYSMFKSHWEALLILYYIMYFITVPYFLAFTAYRDEDYNNGRRDIVDSNNMLMGLPLFSFVEIFINFFSGYETLDGRFVILEKSDIARRYFKTFFIPDIIAAFPGGIITRFGPLNRKYAWIEYFALFKIVRIVSLLRYSKQVCARFQIKFVKRRGFLLLFLTFLYLHWVACAFIFVTMLAHRIDEKPKDSLPGHSSWAQRMKVYDMNPEEVWRHCLVRAASYTFGPSSAMPFSQMHDLAINILCFLFGMVIVIFCAVQMVVITRSVQVGNNLFENLQSQLNSYLNYKRVPRVLHQRISQYFRFRFEHSYYNEAKIMQFLPNHLCQEVYLYKSLSLLETVEMFKKLPPQLAIRLVSSTREQVALRNEVLLVAGSTFNRMFFVIKGTVAIFNNSGNEVCHLQEGAHFGDLALLVEEATSEVSAVALETTRLWTLSRRAFRRALAPDRHLLHSIEDAFRDRLHIHRSDRATPNIGSMNAFVRHMRDTRRAAEKERRKRQEGGQYSSILAHDD